MAEIRLPSVFLWHGTQKFRANSKSKASLDFASAY